MTVYFNRDRVRWVYDFRAAGQRYASYCFDLDGSASQSRRAAARAEARIRDAVERNLKLCRTDDYSLAQAFAELTPAWQNQDDWTNKKRYIAELLAFFGPDAVMSGIDQSWINEYIAFARGQRRKVWCGGPKRDPKAEVNRRFWKIGAGLRSAATINLYLKPLRQALQHATTVQ